MFSTGEDGMGGGRRRGRGRGEGSTGNKSCLAKMPAHVWESESRHWGKRFKFKSHAHSMRNQYPKRENTTVTITDRIQRKCHFAPPFCEAARSKSTGTRYVASTPYTDTIDRTHSGWVRRRRGRKNKSTNRRKEIRRNHNA